MNYCDKYPAATRQQSAGHGEDYKCLEVEVEPNIFFCDRYFPCFICHTITPFIDYTHEYLSRVCSDECKEQAHINHRESENPKDEEPHAEHIPDERHPL